MYGQLVKKPVNVLFRIAVEETESWFLADPKAIRQAYPKTRLNKIDKLYPDQVVGAWERLAEALGQKPHLCHGGDKVEWAERIGPQLDLEPPKSPSLGAFVNGIERILEHRS